MSSPSQPFFGGALRDIQKTAARETTNYGESLIRTIVAKYTCKFPSWTTSKWCLFSKPNIYIYRCTSTGFLVLTLSQQIPLETILENTQFVWLNIFQNNQFSFSYKCKFCGKKKYLHENNMIYIIKNESLYQNKVNSIFDCNCRIGYYCFPFSFRCRCSVCLYYGLHLHALNNQQKRWLSLVYVSGIGRSLSRYMHHSVIQRQYSQKFTTWQEREKLTLSLYRT